MTTLGDGYRPLRDVVCDAIRLQIINGEHAPGSRLVEDRLAEELGVSRNPVREALRVLQTEGFVEMIPRRGAVVSTLSPREVEEIFEVRSALDALAARLAARKVRPDQRELLEQTLEETRAALAADDTAALAVLNNTFHGLLVDIADNSCLRDLWLPLRGRMHWIFSQTVVQRGAHSYGEHFEMVASIIAGDEERAAQLARHHIDAAHDSYMAALARSDDGNGQVDGRVDGHGRGPQSPTTVRSVMSESARNTL